MSALAPLRVSEAGSLAKASSPEPFSTSKTSNWVARKGGLPPYVQHIAHDLIEKGGKTESEAIELAVGIVKNPPAAWGAEAKAAAAKAAGEWEAKKGASKPGSSAKSAAKSVAESISLAHRVTLRTAASGRLRAIEDVVGVSAMESLLEASTPAWSPELKRTASAGTEGERFEVHHEGQMVGMLASRKGYASPGTATRPTRWNAKAVNGKMCSDTEDSKSAALEGLRKHLEEAPARVAQHADGKWLVAEPETYGGQVKYGQFPSEGSARYAAGLPEKETAPERASKVQALGEMIRFDISTLALLRESMPSGMASLAEAASDGPDKEPDNDADDPPFGAGDRVNFQHSTAGRVRARVTKVTSRHVHVSSADPRVAPTRMTHREAASKLSLTRKVRESLSEAGFRSFDEAEHPRGPHGKFAKAFGHMRDAMKVLDAGGSKRSFDSHIVKAKAELPKLHVAQDEMRRASAGYGHDRTGAKRHLKVGIAELDSRDAAPSSSGGKAREAAPAGILGSLLEGAASRSEREIEEASLLEEASITYAERKKLAPGEFVYPDKAPGPGSYPIDTRGRAIAALARAADPANSGDLSDVQAKVWAKYPDLKPAKGK